MDETIAAVATAFGEGGIGIIRISGEEARNILSRIFVAGKSVPEQTAGRKDEMPIVNRQLTYGHICTEGEVLDEVLAVFMKGPATYTREDIAEIYCHGGVVSLEKVLALVLSCGARLAEPGEFTKRAFLNGRIDLAQAEAVIDLIRAKTDRSFAVAMDQMEGSLSGRIKSIRAELMDLLVELAVNLDYPDEDIEEITYERLKESISSISDMVEILLSTADTGRLIREGLRVTIVGKPNVGKSSLMNKLLKESRAIVTDFPGTTRDTIEEVMSLRGIPIYLTDTAGIHETHDPIEKIGIERSKEAFNKADLILFMVDGSEPLREEDRLIAEHVGERKAIVLVNKKDLGKQVTEAELRELLPRAAIIDTSIAEEEGILELEEAIFGLVYGGGIRQDQRGLVANARHKDLLLRAKHALLSGRDMAARKEALDFIEVDVREAYLLLGEIIGDAVAEDIIDQVFERFCLGK